MDTVSRGFNNNNRKVVEMPKRLQAVIIDADKAMTGVLKYRINPHKTLIL